MKYIRNILFSLSLNIAIYLVAKFIFYFDGITSVHLSVMTAMVFSFITLFPYPRKLKNNDKKI